MGAWLAKIRVFFEETMEEMGKCTWPARDQLFESTMLVIVTLVVLAVFVAMADQILLVIINFVTTV